MTGLECPPACMALLAPQPHAHALGAAEVGMLPFPPCTLSAAPAAASSQFVTASVCVLLLTSIAQLMLKSILVLILGHD